VRWFFSPRAQPCLSTAISDSRATRKKPQVFLLRYALAKKTFPGRVRRSLHGSPGQVGCAPNDKGEGRVSSGNWFEGSQVSKARPGAPFDFTLRFHPSISPFDFALRFHPSISPFDVAEGTSFVISLPTRRGKIRRWLDDPWRWRRSARRQPRLPGS
jgi:hypothetical protein